MHFEHKAHAADPLLNNKTFGSPPFGELARHGDNTIPPWMPFHLQTCHPIAPLCQLAIFAKVCLNWGGLESLKPDWDRTFFTSGARILEFTSTSWVRNSGHPELIVTSSQLRSGNVSGQKKFRLEIWIDWDPALLHWEQEIEPSVNPLGFVPFDWLGGVRFSFFAQEVSESRDEWQCQFWIFFLTLKVLLQKPCQKLCDFCYFQISRALWAQCEKYRKHRILVESGNKKCFSTCLSRGNLPVSKQSWVESVSLFSVMDQPKSLLKEFSKTSELKLCGQRGILVDLAKSSFDTIIIFMLDTEGQNKEPYPQEGNEGGRCFCRRFPQSLTPAPCTLQLQILLLHLHTCTLWEKRSQKKETSKRELCLCSSVFSPTAE